MEAETPREKNKEKRQGKTGHFGRQRGGESQSRRVREADGGKEGQRHFQCLSRETKVTLCAKTGSEEQSLWLLALMNLITAPDNTAHSLNPTLGFSPSTSFKTHTYHCKSNTLS